MKEQNKHSYLKNKIFRSSALFITLALLMAACSPAVTEPTLDIQATLAHNVAGTLTAAAPTPIAVVLPTNTLAPTPIAVVLPTNTLAPSPTAVFSGLPAQVNVLNLIMRSGPSKLFERINAFPQGTQVTIMGKISNAEWVQVKDPQGGTGWMLTQFLSQVDLSGVPNIDVLTSLTISGNVVDTAGQGVDGIGITVIQANGSSQLRADTYSLSDGSFVVYLPDSSQGNWNVGTAGIKCTSRIMDANCNATGSVITPTYNITLPQTVTLTFIYDPTQP